MSLGVFMKLSEITNQANAQNFEHKTKPSNFSEKQKNDINQKFNTLKNCSPDELMHKLAKEVSEQKANGTFDYDGLINSIEKIKIYLPTQTYENMLRIIENLK